MNEENGSEDEHSHTNRRGRIDLFSSDALIDMLARLGAHVRVTVKPSRRRAKVA